MKQPNIGASVLVLCGIALLTVGLFIPFPASLPPTSPPCEIQIISPDSWYQYMLECGDTFRDIYGNGYVNVSYINGNQNNDIEIRYRGERILQVPNSYKVFMIGSSLIPNSDTVLTEGMLLWIYGFKDIDASRYPTSDNMMYAKWTNKLWIISVGIREDGSIFVSNPIDLSYEVSKMKNIGKNEFDAVMTIVSDKKFETGFNPYKEAMNRFRTFIRAWFDYRYGNRVEDIELEDNVVKSIEVNVKVPLFMYSQFSGRTFWEFCKYELYLYMPDDLGRYSIPVGSYVSDGIEYLYNENKTPAYSLLTTLYMENTNLYTKNSWLIEEAYGIVKPYEEKQISGIRVVFEASGIIMIIGGIFGAIRTGGFIIGGRF